MPVLNYGLVYIVVIVVAVAILLVVVVVVVVVAVVVRSTSCLLLQLGFQGDLLSFVSILRGYLRGSFL